MAEFGSTETFECFDRVIGSKIDELTPREVLSVFISFSSAKSAQIRPKILQLLLKRLSTALDQLTVSELSHLAIALATDQSTAELLGVHDIICDRSHSLAESDLRDLLIGFKDQQGTRMFEVLEQRLIAEVNGDRVSLATLTEVLYEFAKSRVGSASLITCLVEYCNARAAKLTSLTACHDERFKLFVALNMCGGTKQREGSGAKALKRHLLSKEARLSAEERAVLESARI